LTALKYYKSTHTDVGLNVYVSKLTHQSTKTYIRVSNSVVDLDRLICNLMICYIHIRPVKRVG